MENKKYLDKVIMSLVRGSKIDYEKEEITFPFPTSLIHPSYSSSLFIFLSTSSYPHSFEIYCKNTFGLTGEEIEYAWEQYREIIKNKINNGQ